MKSFDKEAVFQEKILPLVSALVAACVEHGLPIVGSVCFRLNKTEDEGEEEVDAAAFFRTHEDWCPKDFQQAAFQLIGAEQLHKLGYTIIGK